MKKPNFSFYFLFTGCILLLGLWACDGPREKPGGQAAGEKALSGAAEKCCECLQPSIEMNARMRELIQSDRKEEVIQLSEQAGEQARESFNCCLSVWVRVGLDSLSPDPARQLLQQACPQIPPLMLEDLLGVLYPDHHPASD